MNRFPDFPRGGIQQLCQCRFPDQIRNMGADHLHTENIAAAAVGNHFDETVLHPVDNRFANG
ncbi:hypothetical protein D3C75_1345080 [compost metagenome]